jgi:hypothetical protein
MGLLWKTGISIYLNFVILYVHFEVFWLELYFMDEARNYNKVNGFVSFQPNTKKSLV